MKAGSRERAGASVRVKQGGRQTRRRASGRGGDGPRRDRGVGAAAA